MEKPGLANRNNIENAAGPKIQNLSLMKRRDRLSDISNIQRSSRMLPGQENLNLGPLPQTKACIADLLQENTALLRLLGEQNKIIELNALELQKLRVSFHQLQQQNCQLAKANTLMLEDLNLGKDRLKALQHELGCTVAVLKTTKLELEETRKLIQNVANPTVLKGLSSTFDSVEEITEKAVCNPKRKLGSRRLSLGSATVNREESAREKAKRRSSVRTQRSRSSIKSEPPCKGEEQEQQQAINVENCWQNTARVADMKLEEEEEEGSPSEVMKREGGADGEHSAVPSVSGRPQRRSTVGVSYKEKPLNVKMRRA
ncbi:uncharacterized protein LOC144712354 isoform X2 [Wolffia australiana]